MKKAFLFIAAALMTLFISCEKDETLTTETLTDMEEAMVSTDAAADDVSEAMSYEVDYFSSTDQHIEALSSDLKSSEGRGFGYRFLLGVAPEITVVPEGPEYPKTITIDYGEGMELLTGRMLSGKIIIELSDRPLANGATRTITFENFYVDSVQVQGIATRTFTGTTDTEREFSSESTLDFTFADGSVLTREGQRTRTLVEGFETLYDYSDDLILITGSVNYTTDEGVAFGKYISDPLHRLGTCRFVVQGVVTYTYEGEMFAELDYGDGTCDDLATITKNGETRQITIGKRRRIRR